MCSCLMLDPLSPPKAAKKETVDLFSSSNRKKAKNKKLNALFDSDDEEDDPLNLYYIPTP